MKLEEAIALHRQGRLEEAERAYRGIVAADPGNADALHLLGVIASQRGRHAEAVELMDKSIALNPLNAAALYNRGKALKERKRFDAAIESFDRAIALHPAYADAFCERGLALQSIKRLEAAVESYDRAVSLRADYAAAWFNRANALLEKGEAAAAIDSYDRALRLDPGIARAWYNLGVALKREKRWDEAIRSFEEAVRLDPDQEFLRGLLLMTKLDVCEWTDLEIQIEEMKRSIDRGERASPSFVVLACCDSPRLQKMAAEIYVRARHPANNALGPISRAPSDRIRVGYFSADFKNHPVSYLTVGMFECHDRGRVEVFGFSIGPVVEDEMRRRAAAAFDRFVDLQEMSDLEAARVVRELGIDIAIDLGGHTQDARTGIFALRAAPLQASYAGYLGTMGADYYDYIFADPVIIPEHARDDYTEKIAYLPSYQANAATRSFAEHEPSRADLRLPPAGFAFCCFNNSYKMLPDMFACWMRILGRVEGSVLVLYATSETMVAHLRGQASSHGIDPQRIVFAEHVERPEYLSRLRAMDLFLDTYPYNAGTVASDALWAGLPILTLSGETFASRIAASVLHSVGLSELVVQSLDEYEALAIELATHPAKLAGIRSRLERNRDAAALFDILRFTRNMEAAYAAMYERDQAGLAPNHLVIAP